MSTLLFVTNQLFDFILFSELIKLVVATILGFLVGIERESRDRAAGVRTFILITVGSCSMMILARYIIGDLYYSMDADSAMRIDPGRIPSYAIASMGFMGAGVIYKSRGIIKGITTAAGMWIMTVIGLAIGAGYFQLAIMATLFSFITIFILGRFTKRFFHKNDTTLTVIAECKSNQFGKIKNIIQKYSQSKVETIRYEKQINSGSIDILKFQFYFSAKDSFRWELVDKELEEVIKVIKIIVKKGED